MYLTENGWQNGKPPQGSVGAFIGRAGTVSRSRKGRVTRNPNGSRRYITDETTVLAYKAGTSTGISETQMANAAQLALLRKYDIIK